LPTPVSALIHAATMVTAGVYLLIRCSPLIEQSEVALTIILVTGAVTAFFAASVGLFQNDIKKVIAYSTMSQLAQEYFLFRHRTICVKLYWSNSQITKAHNYYYNNKIFFNSFSAKRQYTDILNSISVKWKNFIIGKLVDISEAIRSILILFFSILKKSLIFILILLKDRAIYYYDIPIDDEYDEYREMNKYAPDYTTYMKIFRKDEYKSRLFFEWLAGVLDGDGHFYLSKKGIAWISIVMKKKDVGGLKYIQRELGGSMRLIANGKAFKYKLKHRKGIILLLNGVNGLIRNPIRIIQMNKLCKQYKIELLLPKPLIHNNGWFSGFIDSDGSIDLDEKSGQIYISITQKNLSLLEPLIELYGGRIDIINSNGESYKYTVHRKKQILELVNNYFSTYPLRTRKSTRLELINKFYLLRNGRYYRKGCEFLDWMIFKERWDRY
jgi:hypothetical protein